VEQRRASWAAAAMTPLFPLLALGTRPLCVKRAKLRNEPKLKNAQTIANQLPMQKSENSPSKNEPNFDFRALQIVPSQYIKAIQAYLSLSSVRSLVKE
jgi:hypothetical protein